MKKLGLAASVLLLLGILPAFGAYVEPTSQEQSLYDELRADFEKLTIPKKEVGDTLRSFSDPLVISFPCDTNSLYTFVNATIQTKLARFDNSLSHTGGAITGGIYVWKCSITISGGKMTINCKNELMLNSAAILKSSEKDPQVKQVEDLVIFYHELLHGQLMIDAIKSNESWRDYTCNNPIDEDLDYSYTDAEHVAITPIQTEFASKLIRDAGGTFQVEEIAPEQTNSGEFSKTIGRLYDYPEYIKTGINVSARSYNVADISITSQKNDIIISGTLNDKTKNGIVWLYIFGKPQQEGQIEPPEPEPQPVEIPSWIRSNAKWWADGSIGDSDFVQGIQFLIENNIMTIPQTAQGAAKSEEIPYWIKNNARWWADGMISDSDFVLGIQYLIKNGIMHVGQTQVSAVVPSPQDQLGSIRVVGDTFEKNQYQSTQVRIIGKVNDFKTGTYVILTVLRPDQSSFDLKGILTNKGEFTIPIMIDASSPSGRYAVLAKYDNADLGMTSFIVK
ncbi:MAG: hypothetical protein WAO91_06440 [Candidatus Nitrosotenuis sp.]